MTYTKIPFGGLSDAICRIDGEPALVPPTCWTGDSPFWELFVARKGGGWTSSNLGASAQVFHDGDAEGFRYEAQSDRLPPNTVGNCPSATPAPPASPKPTPRPTSKPSSNPLASSSPGSLPSTSPGSTPAGTAQASSAPVAAGLSPSTAPVADVGGATSGVTATSGTAGAGPAGSGSGSGDGSPALPIAIAAIAGLAGLAALRRRPGPSDTRR